MNDESGAGPWRNPQFVDNAAGTRLAAALTLGNRLREKTRSGFALGTFVIEMPVPATLTSLALAGFDFVVLDMEHSAVDFTRLELLIIAAQAAGLATLVRPAGEDPGTVGKILDMGANGIMAPRVESAQRARDIVAQARFAPLGNRGFSPLTVYDSLREPLRELGESTFVVVQIEGRQGLEHAAEIAAVPGIDVIFVGPYDLALSLGVAPGSAEVSTAAERLADSLPRTCGLGIYVGDPRLCAHWAARRYALQCVSFDGRMLSSGARGIADAARGAMAAKP